jgi:hypothetical protein
VSLRAWVFALALLAVSGLAKTPTLGQPLTENFAWRQTQTAWTALIYHREGIDLLHPQVPVLGPPWHLAFEFPLFQALGALLMDLGFPTDTAMRILGLITFMFTGWLLYLLTARLAGEIAALIALVAFLFSPFGLLWGRTSLIEYLATAASLGFLLAGISWLEHRRPHDFGIALVLGTTAMLVKITTGGFYLLPLLAYRVGGRRMTRTDWPVIVLLAVPPAVGLLWVRHADALKAASNATAFLTSSRLVNWNFGTLDMRIEPAILFPIGAALFVGLAGAGLAIWLPMAAAYVRTHPQWPFFVAIFVSVIVAPPVVLTPLYSSQNYYPAALSPAVAMLIGLAAAWAWERRGVLLPRTALTVGTALWLISLILTRDYWMMSYQPVVDRDRSLAAAEFIRLRTDSNDWVAVDGRGWDPTVLYYAQRRGYMIDDQRDSPVTRETLNEDRRYTLFVACPYEGTCTEVDR